MKSHELLDVIGEAQDSYLLDAKAPKKKSTPVWVKWTAMAACIAIVIAFPMVWNLFNHSGGSTGTLPGDIKIYPTVMVDGQLYEWRKGNAIYNQLPSDCVYYGEISHVKGDTPLNDCEFVSTFSVSGQIYTCQESDKNIYLCLTTDWLNEVVVAFDLITE